MEVGQLFRHKVYDYIEYKLVKMTGRGWSRPLYTLEITKHRSSYEIGRRKIFESKGMRILEPVVKYKNKNNAELTHLLKQ